MNVVGMSAKYSIGISQFTKDFKGPAYYGRNRCRGKMTQKVVGNTESDNHAEVIHIRVMNKNELLLRLGNVNKRHKEFEYALITIQ